MLMKVYIVQCTKQMTKKLIKLNFCTPCNILQMSLNLTMKGKIGSDQKITN